MGKSILAIRNCKCKEPFVEHIPNSETSAEVQVLEQKEQGTGEEMGGEIREEMGPGCGGGSWGPLTILALF